MKKVFIIACALMVIAASGSFALGDEGFAIGGQTAVQFAGPGGLPVGGMLLLHLPRVPLMFGLGFSNAPAIGVTADYWFARDRNTGVFGWYVGVGGYLKMYLETASAAFGARLPLAVQLWPLDRRDLEVFAEVAPALGISFVPTRFVWHLQGALGVRYWF